MKLALIFLTATLWAQQADPERNRAANEILDAHEARIAAENAELTAIAQDMKHTLDSIQPQLVAIELARDRALCLHEYRHWWTRIFRRHVCGV